MTALLLLIMTLLPLTGCSSLQQKEIPKVEIVNRYIPVEIYHPESPAPTNLQDVKLFVITEDNVSEKLAEVERLQGNTPVVFAMTPQDYENMAYNLQELKRYIKQQQLIILYYRDATLITSDINGDGSIDIEDWKLKNKKIVEQFK